MGFGRLQGARDARTNAKLSRFVVLPAGQGPDRRDNITLLGARLCSRHTVSLPAKRVMTSWVSCSGFLSPRNVSVTFNGETEVAEPLALDTWHTITASYRYEGGTSLLTNTYMVIARGGDMLSGLDMGYHFPTNQLNIVKHGYWNLMEAGGRSRRKAARSSRTTRPTWTVRTAGLR